MSPFPVHEITQGSLIEQLARERPERDALVYPDRGLRLSFADLEARSLALARGLLALGIEPGERVAVWADNRPDWIPLQFAVARVGAILVTANTALTGPEVRYLLEQSRSAAVVSAPGRRGQDGTDGTEYYDALGPLVAGEGALPELRHWIALEGEAPAGAMALEELVRRGEEVPPERVTERTAATRPGDAANIQYTSGTTGFPKGVVLTHLNLVENAYAVARLIDTRDTDRMVLQVPLFHCFGCVVTVLGAYTHGIPLVAIQSFDPLAALEAIAAERCTLIHGVPTMFLALLSHPEFPRLQPTTLRAGIMAGAMCPEPLMRRVIDEMNNDGMLVAYGLTEASPGITCSRPEDSVEVRCGTVGRAIPGIEVRVVDPATRRDVPPGSSGELWARGPNIMQGYFEDPEATAETITPEGWLRTGDLATLDEDGLVRIVGRIKEMIIRGGENVYPAEVEDAIRAHPAVLDAAVFGLEHERLGEEVAAAVVLRPGESLDEEGLTAHLEGRLAPFKRPSRVAFVEGFPLTPSGKVQKFKLPAHCGMG